MKNIDHKEYWDEIKSIVENCFDSKVYEDTEEDTWTERLHNQVDGHKWVIYYAYHFDVLKLSENEDYAFDNGLIDASSIKSLSDCLTNCAYWAIYADCDDYFSNNRDKILEGLEAA